MDGGVLAHGLDVRDAYVTGRTPEKLAKVRKFSLVT